MNSENSWIDYFFSFFKLNEQKITAILDASSCRELWIQGELFLYSDELVQPNSGDFHGQRVDLHGKIANLPEMIAELKIVGYQGYSCSDIFGYGGSGYLRDWLNFNKRNYVHPAEHQEKKLAHSIYKDYRKLTSINSKKTKKGIVESYTGEKYLILIIPHRSSSAASRNPKIDENMKKTLHEVEFTAGSKSSSENFNEKSFSVRIWQV